MPDTQTTLRREHHRLVMHVLQAMDADFLTQHHCWFGGGTRIVLELDEYRESVDVDFLCADTAGYRAIRETVTNASFGKLFTVQPELLRDVRADRYGVRSWLKVEGKPIKIEIVSEGRIALSGYNVPGLPVPVLTREDCIAEKLLANTDRGRDSANRSRDLIDLAYMAAAWPDEGFSSALSRAQGAYGDSVLRELLWTLDCFKDTDYKQRCTTSLALEFPDRLSQGIARLRALFDPDTTQSSNRA